MMELVIAVTIGLLTLIVLVLVVSVSLIVYIEFTEFLQGRRDGARKKP